MLLFTSHLMFQEQLDCFQGLDIDRKRQTDRDNFYPCVVFLLDGVRHFILGALYLPSELYFRTVNWL